MHRVAFVGGEQVLDSVRDDERFELLLGAQLFSQARLAECDLLLSTTEWKEEVAATVSLARQAGVPSLTLADGIIEWRNTWEHPFSDRKLAAPLWQPVQSDKIACIGPAQVRILESWGNGGKCELVGLPRLDDLVRDRPAPPSPARTCRVLIATARTPAFTPAQRDRVVTSLRDLAEALAQDTFKHIEPVWRLTGDLEADIPLATDARRSAEASFADAVRQVDAVITTPSTSMVEAMLMSRPTAILDYTNSPPYWQAAWTVTARPHIEPALGELFDAPATKLLYQEAALRDLLLIGASPRQRLHTLMEAMCACGQRRREDGALLELPRRILDAPAGDDGAAGFAVGDLYATLPLLADAGDVGRDVEADRLRAEVDRLRGVLDDIRRHPLRAAWRAVSRRLFGRT